MQLHMLREEFCRCCNSHTVGISCERHHTNGEGFEERRFSCGCVIAWSPNFSRIEIKIKCPKDPERIAKQQKQQKLLHELKVIVENSEVDVSFKKRIIDYLPSA